MADKRRFELFAQRFPAPRIFDIAGGQGRLNEALTRLGRTVTTFDLPMDGRARVLIGQP